MKPLTLFIFIGFQLSLSSALSLRNFQSPMGMKTRPKAEHEPSPECVNGGYLFCCPTVHNGEDGPCQDPKSALMVAECRRAWPHGLACCVDEKAERDWYCWPV
ncbi:hypothetical protein CC78DRAFT_287811 [Lojkania enalia]|uniref:Uncharacterized protein n=1 Tax=Lojkania enalia TaxID=147567 RepID=A0A9P4K8F5_9PLEO|nr:hypothetical protein CC78DRAFT_287811 [Didymosphaeria enalia]